jgi:hypothetical protein
MTRRTATQRSKWFAPTHTDDKVSNHGSQSPATGNARKAGVGVFESWVKRDQSRLPPLDFRYAR